MAEDRFAYVTLFSDDRYLPGVQALKKSLHLTHTSHDLIVLHTNNISKTSMRSLEGLNCDLRLVETFDPSGQFFVPLFGVGTLCFTFFISQM